MCKVKSVWFQAYPAADYSGQQAQKMDYYFPLRKHILLTYYQKL